MACYSSRTCSDAECSPLLSRRADYQLADNSRDTHSRPDGDDDQEEVEKELLRKVDLRMTILLLIYILSYIDRSSTAAARLRGFEKDLRLQGSQFATVLSVFYIGYISVQIPSNVFLGQIDRPSVYLPLCMIGCGIVSFYTGIATNYHQAIVARFLLGLMEATFFPGAIYLISRWYKRNELSRRMAYFICGNLFSSAFGALIASLILDTMDGILGYTAWRWLFFIEGGLTTIASTAALFVLPDFPEVKTISWLSPAEHALAKQRMLEDTNDSAPNADAMSGLTLALMDWKVWYLAMILFLSNVSTSFMLYFPTLTATMGCGPTISLLLCAPPWLFAALWCLWICGRSDRTQERCMHIIIPMAVAIGGFIIAMSTMNPFARYASLFLMTQSSSSGVCFFAWASSTVSRPPAKRAGALAIIAALSQSGNIAGSYIWAKEWGPTYTRSFAICSLTYFISMMMCLQLKLFLQKLNRRMDIEDSKQEGVKGPMNGWRYHV